MALLVTQPIALSTEEDTGYPTSRKAVGGRAARVTGRQVLHYWHLLSLDAPSVATLWAFSFARALHLALPAASLLLLFAGTWLLYIADRILDGLRQNDARLRERHLFYIRNRAAVLAAAIPVSIFLAWLIFAHMLPAARRDDLILFTAAAAYFCCVHLRAAKIERWFPKELIVALIFASATAVPAFARIAPSPARTSVFHAAAIANHSPVVLPILATLFAALCWLNCVSIEKWENLAGPVRPTQSQYPQAQVTDHTTRWGQRHLRAISVAITLSALAAAALLLRSNPAAAALCFAASLSSAILLALDRAPLATFHLRIAADAALLTPLALLLIR